MRTEKPEEMSPSSKLRAAAGRQHAAAGDERPPALARSLALTIAVPGGITLSAWHADGGVAAPLVIFFHGYTTENAARSPKIHAMGASVLLVDFRGSGGSSKAILTLRYREAEDVAAAVRFAREHPACSAVILYGQRWVPPPSCAPSTS